MPAIGMRPWTPKLLTTVAWYDASDVSTITESGGKVSQLDDKSGNANHLAQATPTDQPDLTTLANGMKALQFDGTNHNIYNSTIDLGSGSPAMQMMGVFIPGSTFANDDYYFGYSTGTLFANKVFAASNKGNATDNELTVRTFSGYIESNIIQTTDTAFVFSTSKDLNAQQQDTEIVIDGTVATVTANDPTDGWSFDATNSELCIGSGRSDSTNHAECTMCEFILFDSQLSEENRQRIEGYLAHKWGLTANLPEDHPFKYRPPTDSSLATEDWDPTSIATEAWFDPSDIATITDVAGEVSQLADKSGNDRHLLQATGGIQPTTGVRSINDRNVLDCDGDDYMRTGDFSWPASGNVAVFMVAEIDVVDNSNDGIFGTVDGGANLDFDFRAGNAVQFDGQVFAANLGGSQNCSGGPFPGPSIFNANFDWDNSILNGFVDGTKRTADGTYSTKFSVTAALNAFAKANNSTQKPDGAFGEIIVVEDVSYKTRQKIEGYLAHKWGLTANLPANHPYKTKKPQRDKLWTPNDITTNAWYDAADSGTIIDTTDPGFAEQWSDKSGNDRHLVQTNLSKKPATGTRKIGALNALDFVNAVSSGMRVDTGVSIGDYHELYVVIDKDDLDTNRTLLHIAEIGQPHYMDDYAYGGYGYRGTVNPSGGGQQFGTIREQIDQVMLGYNGVGYYKYVNGEQVGVTSNTPGTLPVNRISIGMNGFQGNSFDGLIGEVVITAPLSLADRQKMEGYLAWKWGNPHNLPDTHPYKRRPPMA